VAADAPDAHALVARAGGFSGERFLERLAGVVHDALTSR
jgi:hypothetical protein